MATMLHYDSSSSAWSLDSSALPITPTLSTTSNVGTEPGLQPSTLQETHRLLTAIPLLNTTAISISKSETNISALAKPFSVISPAIRPSPSLSVLQQRSEKRVEHEEPTYFGTHVRRRSNSIPEQHLPSMDRVSSKGVPLAERRRSETSRYLGTDDFKSAFATNLLKLKEREKVDGDPTPHSNDPASKTVETCASLSPAVRSQVKGMSCELPLVRGVKSDLVVTQNSINQADDTHGAPTQKPYNAVQISSTVGQLMNLPAEELAAQLEKHFNRLKTDRMEDELEARNEVISILAHQMSNQLEVNDKLLHELAALRAAYASLQSSCTDYVDELELLKMRLRTMETENEVDRCRRESEDALRGLGQLGLVRKTAFSRLQPEILHQDKGRSFQNYHLEPRRNSSYTITGEAAGVLSSPRRNSSCALGGQTAGVPNTATKRSTLLVLSSENPQKFNEGPLTAPGLTSLIFPFKSAQVEAVQNNSIDRNLATPTFETIHKPARPPKSAARSNPVSPAANKFPRNQPLKSILALSRVDGGTPTSDLVEAEELEELKRRCAQLELQLNESEDSRVASQEALGALRNYISSQPQSDISTIKLPPLPTDLQPEHNNEEATSNRWNLSNLMSRSNPLKSTGTGPPSPYLQSPSMLGSPAFGNAFSGFSIWGRSPVLG